MIRAPHRVGSVAARLFASALTSLVICIVFVGPAAAAAEEGAAGAEEGDSETEARSVPPGMVLDMVLASVDGEPVTLSDLRRFIASQGGTPPADVQSGDFEIRRQLRELVIDQLLRKEARDAGITVENEEIEAYIAEIKKQNSVDDAGFEAILQSRGLTLQDYQNQVRGDIMRARILNSKVRSKINILDADVQSYLKEHPELLPKQGEVRVQQILLRRDDPQYGSELERQEKAAEMRSALTDGGNWAEVGGDNFQDLGFVKAAELREELQAAVAHLQPGQVSDVIETSLGSHLLRVVVRNDSETGVDQSILAQVREQLFQERYKTEVDRYLNDELPKKYHVELKL